MSLPPSPLVSVVVPVLEDAPAVARLLQSCPLHPQVQMLVVDGGYDARLGDLAGDRPDVRVLRAPRGRGRHMNAGAAAASGTWLLFLHADSTLPPGWLDYLAGLGPEVVGGWFRFALDTAPGRRDGSSGSWPGASGGSAFPAAIRESSCAGPRSSPHGGSRLRP